MPISRRFIGRDDATFLVGGGDIDYAIAFVDDLKECLPIACR
jgi:hypothetical protein